jgi:hypothetical protein
MSVLFPAYEKISQHIVFTRVACAGNKDQPRQALLRRGTIRRKNFNFRKTGNMRDGGQ